MGISPIFIASLSSSSSIASLSDVKLVSTQLSLVRLKDEKCETSPLSVASWYHLLTLMVSGLSLPRPGASVNLSGFITSSFNSRSTLCLEKSQRLMEVVLDALSVFSRIFRPPIDSADTRGKPRGTSAGERAERADSTIQLLSDQLISFALNAWRMFRRRPDF